MSNSDEFPIDFTQKDRARLQVDELIKICGNEAAAWGIARAIDAFKSVNDFEEEARTAALWPYISTWMEITNSSFKKHKPDTALKYFHWHLARKKTRNNTPGEEVHGGDFAVAVDIGSDHYRITLFQAKIGKENAVDVSKSPSNTQISSAVHKYFENNVGASKGDKSQKNKPTDKQLSVQCGIFKSESEERIEHWIQTGNLKVASPFEVNYQLYKLALTESLGNTGNIGTGGTFQPWCHYAIWSESAPTVFSLSELRSWIKTEADKEMTSLAEEIKELKHKRSKLNVHNAYYQPKKETLTSNIKTKEDEHSNFRAMSKLPKIKTSHPGAPDNLNLPLKLFSHHLARGFCRSPHQINGDGWITLDKTTISNLIGELTRSNVEFYIATPSDLTPDLGNEHTEITRIEPMVAEEIKTDIAVSKTAKTTTIKKGF